MFPLNVYLDVLNFSQTYLRKKTEFWPIFQVNILKSALLLLLINYECPDENVE